MSMANSRELVGKCALVKTAPIEAAFGGFLGVIRTHILEPHYLLKILTTNYARESLIDSATQTTNIANVSLGKLNPFLIPLPPLAEQRRIVARIDQLMARCDELEALRAAQEHKRVQVHRAVLREMTADNDPAEFRANWQFLAEHFGELHATPQNVTELRSAVLQLAVMGKLVPQDPSEGTVAELLIQIADEKKRLVAEGKIKTPKPLPPVSEAEQPYQVPQGWTWVRFQDIFSDLKYGTAQKCDYGGGIHPVLRIPNLVNGRIDLSDLKSTNLNENEALDLALRENDLLLIRSNGSENLVGRPALVGKEGAGLCYAGYLIRVRFTKYLRSPIYLIFALNSKFIRDSIERPIRSTSGVKNINSTEISRLLLPLPPLAEQQRIVAKVDSLMALCDALELRLKERTVKQGELLSALMAELAPKLSAGRPVVSSRARGQAPVQVAAVPGAVGERRGRGRPRKEASTLTSSPARSIPEASSVEEAIRRLEARKVERATGSRQVGLFDEDN